MIYLDNASTTKIIPEVSKVISDAMNEIYGNPSSTHAIGRKSKAVIESARNSLAYMLGCKAKEIIFTSGATESNNYIISNAINNIGVKRIISSPIEHHSILEYIQKIETENNDIEVIWLKINHFGCIDLEELESLLKNKKTTLVSLMHVNNEIGNINDIEAIGDLCKKYNSFFHSDTTQSISHLDYNLSKLNIDFICGSAHKFGGPKGIGFMYKKESANFKKQVFGGKQEKNLRAGTENIYGIIGMQKALEVANTEKNETENHITNLKKHLITTIKERFPYISFNGLSDNLTKSIPKIVSINISDEKKHNMTAFLFDLKGIAISQGSACASGRNLGSHVIKEINDNSNGTNIRVSFCKTNTIEEVNTFIEVLKDILK